MKMYQDSGALLIQQEGEKYFFYNAFGKKKYLSVEELLNFQKLHDIRKTNLGV